MDDNAIDLLDRVFLNLLLRYLSVALSVLLDLVLHPYLDEAANHNNAFKVERVLCYLDVFFWEEVDFKQHVKADKEFVAHHLDCCKFILFEALTLQLFASLHLLFGQEK